MANRELTPQEAANVGECRCCGLKLPLVAHWGLCRECDRAVKSFMEVRGSQLKMRRRLAEEAAEVKE